jgi:diguanylate cyclase
VALLDLDRFKAINDTHGHGFGDEVLAAVAGRLTQALGTECLVARLGGDEYAVLVPDDNPTDLFRRMNDAQTEVGRPITIGSVTVTVTVSIGVAIRVADHVTPTDLLRGADVALYEAKATGDPVVRRF